MNSDTVAERQVLALALSGHPSIRERFLSLPLDSFTPGTHQLVAGVLRDRYTRAVPVDAETVAVAVAELAGTDHKAETARAFVLAAAITPPTMDSWPYYAELLVTAATARRGAAAGRHLLQRLEIAEDASEVAEALRVMRSDLEQASAGLVTTAAQPPQSLEDLLNEPVQPFDWLVPGLWERTDRLMVTGYEGTGKSFLLAQFALTIAAGLHPFTGVPYAPDGHRVVVVDCENSKRQIRRRYEQIVTKVNQQREMYGMSQIDWSKHLRFVLRPEGINLGDAQEAARLEQAIALSAPDMVVAGPIYRMHKTNINEEQAARELVDALDRLRVRYHFMLITEAHCGHVGETGGGRKLRPTGSSLFLRWPEFGYGLKPFGPGLEEQHPSVVQMTAWRGARDERHWPEVLSHGNGTDRFLPWMPPDLIKYQADEPAGLTQSTLRSVS
jgi:hypothetical protein